VNRTSKQLELVAEKLREGQYVALVVGGERRAAELRKRLEAYADLPKIVQRGRHSLRFANNALLVFADITRSDDLRGVQAHAAVYERWLSASKPASVREAADETIRLLHDRGTELHEMEPE
jgi:hypothetical protein